MSIRLSLSLQHCRAGRSQYKLYSVEAMPGCPPLMLQVYSWVGLIYVEVLSGTLEASAASHATYCSC